MTCQSIKAIVCLSFLVFEILQVDGARSYFETNEVTYSSEAREQDLLKCPSHAICGFLQANTRGINKQPLCSCENSICPMHWDSTDGQSITQGSDQYKFCEKTEPPAACEPGRTAYTSRIVYSKTTDEIITKVDRVHCLCPDGYNYELANQKFEDVNPDAEAMEFFYVCKALPECGIGDHCKVISEKGPEFLVNNKCKCPGNLRCPTVSKNQKATSPMGGGMIHMVRCQY